MLSNKIGHNDVLRHYSQPLLGEQEKQRDWHNLLQFCSSDPSWQSCSLSQWKWGGMQLVWLNLYTEHVNSPESQSGAAKRKKSFDKNIWSFLQFQAMTYDNRIRPRLHRNPCDNRTPISWERTCRPLRIGTARSCIFRLHLEKKKISVWTNLINFSWTLIIVFPFNIQMSVERKNRYQHALESFRKNLRVSP